MRYMEPPHLLSLCVVELDDTLPPYGCYIGYCRATHGVSAEAYVRKMALGRGRNWPDTLITLWTVATRGALPAHMCSVVRFIPLQIWLLIRISVTPSDMGDALFTTPKHSNTTFIMLYLIHEMDIDYLVVDEMINVSKLFDYTCMFNIGCKLILLITYTWLKAT
jgi:hypothetical protein